MHSRYARNLYDSKIKIIFEIAWALFVEAMLGLLHVAGLFLWTAMNQLERADFFSRVAILDLFSCTAFSRDGLHSP